MEDSLDIRYSKTILLKLYEKGGNAKKSDLVHFTSGWTALGQVLTSLKNDGYVDISEQMLGRRTYTIQLTDRGRAVAQKLKEVEEIGSGNIAQEEEMLDLPLTDEEVEKAKHISLLYHVNVSDDHVTVQELIPGKPSRIFNIYIKRNGGGNFRLWCEHDNSYDCWHVKTAWTYPQVQQMMMHYRGKTRICISCNYENPEEAQYCMHCGARLE